MHEVLREGLYGWQVTDCAVTLTYSHYWPRQSHAHAHFDKSMSSTAGDFRNLTPLVVMGTLAQAGTMVYEPLHRFHIEIPADTFGAAMPVLARLRAHAESVARAEVEKTLASLQGLDEKQQKTVRAMASAIVNKLLHTPTSRLRTEAGRGPLGEATAELFGLEAEPEQPGEPASSEQARAESAAEGAVLPLLRKR